MKSFNSVYKSEEKKTLNENQVEYDKQRAKLVNAIKKEFGVNDFSQLTESERKSYKSMINEMWSKEKGLNTKGYMFLAEACAPLTKNSTEEQIEKCFKKKVKANAAKCVMALIKGERCEIISDCKSEIENKTGKKISDNKYKKWVFDVCGKFLGESIKVDKETFRPLNEYSSYRAVFVYCNNDHTIGFDFLPTRGKGDREVYTLKTPIDGQDEFKLYRRNFENLGKIETSVPLDVPIKLEKLKVFTKEAAEVISEYPVMLGYEPIPLNLLLSDGRDYTFDGDINNVLLSTFNNNFAASNLIARKYGKESFYEETPERQREIRSEITAYVDNFEERAKKLGRNYYSTNEGALKNAAIGGLTALSLLAGTPSCTNINAPENRYEQVQDINVWQYENFSGNEFQASMFKLKDKEVIEDLQINQVKYKSFTQVNDGMAHPGVWGTDGGQRKYPPYFKETKYNRELGLVEDYYYTPEVSYDGADMSCYIVVYYTKNEREDMKDRIQYIGVFHNLEDRAETEFYILLDDLRDGTGGGIFYVH